MSERTVRQLYNDLKAANERIAALEADLAATQKRCNEAYGNVSALFGEFMNISLLTPLGGEVDDYEDVTKAVAQIVAERDKLKVLCESLTESLSDMVNQHCSEPDGSLYSGHLSANALSMKTLEEAGEIEITESRGRHARGRWVKPETK